VSSGVAEALDLEPAMEPIVESEEAFTRNRLLFLKDCCPLSAAAADDLGSAEVTKAR
jgi:hypothetical protein